MAVKWSRFARGTLWGGAVAAALAAAAAGTVAYRAAAWSSRYDALRDAPAQLAGILSDRTFQEGLRRWRERQAGTDREPVSVATLRGWVNAAAGKIPSFQQAHLRVEQVSVGGGSAGGAEIRAVLQLAEVDTRRLQALIHEVEDKHPDLVCKELTLRRGQNPYRYEVSQIVFAVRVTAL